MANEEHIKILKQGPRKWDYWRCVHPEVLPDFSGADFDHSNISEKDITRSETRSRHIHIAGGGSLNLLGSNFTRANLTRANLAGANLKRADLSGAFLREADLRETNLTSARLRGAFLTGARLTAANLSDAELIGADLVGADLGSAKLSGANLDQAVIGNTILTDIDFREVKGLEGIKHKGPSEISISTMDRSGGKIPEGFLRGCGLRDWEIEAAKLYRTDFTSDQIIELTYKIVELRSDPLIQFNSCFISYSSEDEEFARRLYSDLQESGVRCWFAPEDMKIGDRIRNRLDYSIRLHDKLLLILSRTSVSSQWIEQEVETALEKERAQRCDVLFPIRLDDTVMHWRGGWPNLVRNTRHIGDFCRWYYPSEYMKSFKRLLDDLRF